MIEVVLNHVADAAPLNPLWNFGANTCHAPLWLRDDLLQQISLSRRELGFQYIRAHGLLCDRMEILQPDGSFDFTKVGQAYDRLLASGLRPFVELSHMPSRMSRSQNPITKYQFFGGPPRDWRLWYRLIKALATFFKQRYGAEEVRQWYFEVWNEPDLAFWRGTQAEYFRLYDLAACAVKEVDARFRIGGPATSKTAWIGEFCRHVSKPSRYFPLDLPRCDFVSTHAYPSDLAFVDNDRGAVQLVNSNIMHTLFAEARQQVDEVFGPDMPLICGEWNSSAGPLACNHDACNNAAFIVKTMVELMPLCQGSLYWDLSDIYEECGFHYEPFHGGYGLMTANQIRKSSWHAFTMLHEHTGTRVAATLSRKIDGMGCLATRAGDRSRLLVYWYQEPDARAAKPQMLKVKGLPAGVRPALVRRVLPGQGSAYEKWMELGRPDYLTRDILAQLEQASVPEESRIDLKREGILMQPGTVAQITWRQPRD